MKEFFEHWYEVGWQDPNRPLACPPWPKVADYLAKMLRDREKVPNTVLLAEGYIKNWQGYGNILPLKVRPLWRLADVAICKGGEVIKIRIAQAHQLPSGIWLAEREKYPSSERWGMDGFTYTANSHSDPWAAVFARVIYLLARGQEEETD